MYVKSNLEFFLNHLFVHAAWWECDARSVRVEREVFDFFVVGFALECCELLSKDAVAWCVAGSFLEVEGLVEDEFAREFCFFVGPFNKLWEGLLV